MFWSELYHIVVNSANLLIEYIVSFDKRTSFLYLISSFLLAYFVYKKSHQRKSFLHYVLARKVWLGKSAQVDYLIIVFNVFTKLIVITPMLFLALALQHEINSFLITFFGHFTFNVSVWVIITGYTICIWVFKDLGTYIIHYIFHHVPFMWEFHKIHHAATTLTPFTLYRIHPVELIINNLVSMFVFGVVTGIFYYLAGGEVGTLTFIGVNIFTFIFMFFGANLRHSHVKLRFYDWLENIFISPYQHQIHHSDHPLHFNKNLGSNLAIWDRFFGTLIKSEEVEKIRFGLGKNDNKNYDNFIKNLVMPFKNLMSFFKF